MLGQILLPTDGMLILVSVFLELIPLSRFSDATSVGNAKSFWGYVHQLQPLL